MRRKVTRETLQRFMQELAAAARGPGKVYFTGGATALLLGFREQTIDVDLKLDPEPAGAFEAIAVLKNRLDLNVKLASPADFIPVAPDWSEHSRRIATIGQVQFLHFDFSMQALAKLERGHAEDLLDVVRLMRPGYLAPDELRARFLVIQPHLVRYPAIDPPSFARSVERFLAEIEKGADVEPVAALPRQETVEQGLKDLYENRVTELSLLVLIAGPRLRSLGLQIPETDFPRPYEQSLYERIEERLGAGAHSYYNSLIRRIVSYARARDRQAPSGATCL
jgi:hypothetical protein